MTGNFAFLNLGVAELVLILLVVLLLFGSKKLPELAKSLGGSMRELRKGLGDSDGDKSQKQTEDKKPARDETAS